MFFSYTLSIFYIIKILEQWYLLIIKIDLVITEEVINCSKIYHLPNID
jgi:hypothetical protein